MGDGDGRHGPAAGRPGAGGSPGDASDAAAGFSKEQLEQIVAPMALYPDPVVSMMLMASTYPLEIVQAARWVRANPGLKDKALEEALKQHDWDASVKSMTGFPDVLKQMDENLDWTQDLGDAFLAQKTELMDTIQRMRGKAYDSGNLKTTEQQVVTQQPDKIIVVEPADPQVIYVPTYSSTVVYGGWSYPYYYYPPMYVAPPYGYGAMAFTVGVMWGAAVWGGANWGWGSSDVDIDIDHHNNFNRNTSIDGGRGNLSDKAGGKAVVAARCLAPRRRQLPRQQDRAAVRRADGFEPRHARPGARLRSRRCGRSLGRRQVGGRPARSQRIDGRGRWPAAEPDAFRFDP